MNHERVFEQIDNPTLLIISWTLFKYLGQDYQVLSQWTHVRTMIVHLFLIWPGHRFTIATIIDNVSNNFNLWSRQTPDTSRVRQLYYHPNYHNKLVTLHILYQICWWGMWRNCDVRHDNSRLHDVLCSSSDGEHPVISVVRSVENSSLITATFAISYTYALSNERTTLCNSNQ